MLSKIDELSIQNDLKDASAIFSEASTQKLTPEQQNQLMDWVAQMKNDKTVLELQIQGLQDHIVGLHKDHNELMNECFLKDEQIDQLKI